MPTMKEYLKKDGNIAFDLAIYNRFSSIGDICYSDICGGFIDGVYQWASHNIQDIKECKNEKYVGWEIMLGSGDEFIAKKVYIPSWVMSTNPKSWKHAKNLFNKYLQVVVE